jgi:hypothetical protein
VVLLILSLRKFRKPQLKARDHFTSLSFHSLFVIFNRIDARLLGEPANKIFDNK